MGNIITLSPGDLVDRQTILQIKIERCGVRSDTGLAPKSVEMMEYTPQRSITRTVLTEKTEVNIQPFLIEHEAIQQRLELDWFSKLPSGSVMDFEMLMEKLSSVNKELWKLEDQARILRSAPDKFLDTVLRRKAETLDGITMSNDWRIELVKGINALWGISVEEKIYSI